MIDFYIDPLKICIFGKTTCTFCQNVINLLEQYTVNIQYIELDKITEGPILSNQLQRTTSQRTIPNIFIFGKHIGGFLELVKLHNQGILHNLIDENKLKRICDFCGKESVDKYNICNCFPRHIDDWK